MTHAAAAPAAAPDAVPFVAVETLFADPPGALSALRDETPLIRIDEAHYLALRAADVLALMRDPRTTQLPGPAYVAMAGIPDGHVARFLSDIFLLRDGADHAARRQPFARAFAYPAMQALRPRLRAIVEAALAEVPRGEPFDFTAAVAQRVPAEAVAGILGLPLADAAHFAGLVGIVSATLGAPYPLDRHDQIEAATAELHDYVAAELARRRNAPRHDAMSALAASDRLDEAAQVHQAMGVILAGSDTTRAGFTMALGMLLQRPADWAAVCTDPALVAGAVSEALRLAPPVASVPRFLPEALDVAGFTLPGGSLLSLSTLSAMRDPLLYADPDRFDIRRGDHPRLQPVFGGGAHRCLGEVLARAEMEEGLAALAAFAPQVELVEPPAMLGFAGIRRVVPMTLRIP